MASENKIQEYQNILEEEKLMIETHFVNIERILRELKELDRLPEYLLLENVKTIKAKVVNNLLFLNNH